MLHAFLIRIDDIHDPVGTHHNVCQTAEGLLLTYDSEQDVVKQRAVHIINNCLHLDRRWCRSFHLADVEAFPLVTVDENGAMLGEDPVHLAGVERPDEGSLRKEVRHRVEERGPAV